MTGQKVFSTSKIGKVGICFKVFRVNEYIGGGDEEYLSNYVSLGYDT